MSWVIDLKADGWLDDGSESGVVKTFKNDIVIVPFEKEPVGESSGATLNTFYYGLAGGSIGNGQSLTMALPIGANNYVRRILPFVGTKFGVVRENSAVSNNEPYTVVIDGVSYKAGYDANTNKAPIRWDTKANLDDGRYIEMISVNLEDCPHVAEIILQGSVSTTSTIKIIGLALSRNAGYEKPQNASWYINKTALTTTPTALSSLISTDLIAVSKFIFSNDTAGNIQVKCSYSGIATLFAKTVPANETIEWEFSTPITITKSLYQFSASANTSITMTVIGRN